MPHFRLVPFTPDPLVSALVLTGTVERDGSVLRAAYRLAGAGPLSALLIPAPSAAPARQDNLWRATCFELFASFGADRRYLEVNLSPTGDWNAYSFTAYREAMLPLPVARFTPRCPGPGPTALELGFELELGPDLPLAPPLEVAVTAVIEHAGGARSYWALAHTGDRPDFHRRDSFLLRL